MNLKFKIFCTCGCEYTTNECICASRVICPNCGVEYPFSQKLISVLKEAKEIPDGCFFNNEHRIEVISSEEDMKMHQ